MAYDRILSRYTAFSLFSGSGHKFGKPKQLVRPIDIEGANMSSDLHIIKNSVIVHDISEEDMDCKIRQEQMVIKQLNPVFLNAKITPITRSFTYSATLVTVVTYDLSLIHI